MPSLFNRRSRSVSTSRPTTPASNSAHMAAAQAFLANKQSQSNLSASAAAAALRTMSPPPTPVDQVQTKRMLNRQTSNASNASAARGRSRPNVQRRSSSASMSERTFRSPSPGRSANLPPPAPSAGAGRGRAPPVPPVPQNYSTENISSVPMKTHRRSASMDTAPRAAPVQTQRPAGRGQKTAQAEPATSAAALAAKRSTNARPTAELQRSDSADSRNSFNFSYPRGSRPTSPPPRSPLATTSDSVAPIVSNGISAVEVARIQNDLNQTATKPVKKKKKKIDPSAVEGSHLATGTMGAKPTTAPLAAASIEDPQPEEIQPTKKPKKKAVMTGQGGHFADSEESFVSQSAGSDSDTASDYSRDRKSKRASGVLMKQPSVVKEDWDGEREGEFDSSPITDAVTRETAPKASNDASPIPTTKRRQPEANMSRKIEDHSPATRNPPAVHESVTLSSPRSSETSNTSALSPQILESKAVRGVSISPSRSTRFSDRLSSDLAAGRKHEPLGRSVSPGKSALKHISPAGSEASPMDPRFPQRRGSSVTPSESSDVSAENLPERKKSTRVSFEVVPEVAKTPEAQPAKDSKKGWFGLGKNRTSNLSPSTADDDLEEMMKPRPALPSFGSVRRTERSMSPANKDKKTREAPLSVQSTTSSESSLADPATMDTSISSDHALGAFLSKPSTKNPTMAYRSQTDQPLPPQVTSVEVTGYASDSDSLYSQDDDTHLRATQAASKQLEKSVKDKRSLGTQEEAIPAIAVQPATPGQDESQPMDEWIADLPGGFPEVAPTKDEVSSTVRTNEEPYHDDRPTSPQLMTITEEDSDHSSLYSDAAEDLSDLEGDGFGSINAIVESPVVKSPQQRRNSPPESPLAAVNQKRPVEAEKIASWDDTQAHWSGLAQRFRSNAQASEESLTAPTGGRTTDTAVKTSAKPKKKVTQPKSAAVSEKPKTVAQTDLPATKQVPKQLPASPVLVTKDTRVEKPPIPLKSSMRGKATATPSPRQQPAAAVAPAQPRAALQKKNTPRTAAPKPPVRKFSNDSDSDSSFRKARRGKKATDGNYIMRKSMRGGPAAAAQPPAPAGRGGVRSLSPVDRRPMSPAGMRSMKSSMRGSADTGTPTLRGQPESKRSSSLFSFNRRTKSPTRPAGFSSGPSKLKSRVVDSDDEDEPRPTHYKSRFADSSDEDEPKTFTPVRGIPRRKDEGDSTDLDDSSDDQGRKSKSTAAPKKLAIVPPPATEEVSSPPLSPTTAKKRGLWGRLRGKKKEEAEPSSVPITTEREDAKPEAEVTKDEPASAKQLGFNSAAEREALVEQTRLKLEAAKDLPDIPEPPTSKLNNRRTKPQRILSDSWARPNIPAALDDRPQTSGNAPRTSRPELGVRQGTTETLETNTDSALGKGGKKKKFGFLRKAFRLDE